VGHEHNLSLSKNTGCYSAPPSSPPPLRRSRKAPPAFLLSVAPCLSSLSPHRSTVRAVMRDELGSEGFVGWCCSGVRRGRSHLG
jgi:hypothetical protein